jgi:hypothetical protein
VGLAVPLFKHLVTGFPPQRPGFEPGSDYVEFVMDKSALVLVFSEYFCFPCQALHRLLHIHHYPGLVQ